MYSRHSSRRLPEAFRWDYRPENIDLIKDVPLEVTVELGRTSKSIKEILDFAPGTIIELNRIAGEPIDVLVNGKYVAKGEVVSYRGKLWYPYYRDCKVIGNRIRKAI